jgi:cytochrome c oxidase cbb3-type subunit 3
MSDFVSDFWSLYVAVIVFVGIAGCAVFLWSQNVGVAAKDGGNADTTGHVWDETLEEFNNPLPKWWMWMFYLTVAFALGYLALYPGLGSYKGSLNWSSKGQYEAEIKKADETYGPIYEKYLKMDLKAVAADKQANEMGQRLFLTYCAQCHGSDAHGSKGFPNLADNDWLWGGEPETIEKTILEGRQGMMPAYGGNPDAVGGEAGAKEVANFVRSLSGLSHDAELAAKGKEKFATVCFACHGPEGKGQTAMGAPNLTDKTWLYGSSEATIVETITKGRANRMPAWKDFLGEAKVHLLAAYVLSLSGGDKK